MNKLKLGLIMPLCIVFLSGLLVGCTDAEVKTVKGARHFSEMPTYGKILDDLADCGSTKWAVATNDAGYKYVIATCKLSRSMSSDVREQALALADKGLTEVVKANKDYYVGMLKRDAESVKSLSEALAGQEPSPYSGNFKQLQEISPRLQARRDGADAYMAEIDGRKQKSLQAFKELIESGDLASQYFFQVRGEQARVNSMVLLIGERKAAVDSGDERLTLMRYTKRDEVMEKNWWAQRLAAYASAESIQACSYLDGCRN
ncbi:hypothetical protein [Polaromonas sp.]|uniref:hypothetical protein n=1 Tax=Polaromonas sp. TaxID=1869339 RepID=UPI003529F06F